MSARSKEYQQTIDPKTEKRMIEALESLNKSSADVDDHTKKRNLKPALTIDILEACLKEMNIEIKLNQITHEISFSGLASKYNPESSISDLAVILSNELKVKYSQCSKDTVMDYLKVLAGMHRYNPVSDYLTSLTWDGKDYLNEFYDVLGIKNDDSLSRTLIQKWLWQCVALSQNDLKHPFGADGVLVLNGAQGIGKTSVGHALGTKHGFFTEGMYIDKQDKDTTRRCISNWIVELGEIETTFRSDLERLKAFITAPIDIYRLPYVRSDEKTVRRTSIIATCNTTDFLIDPTGSRRFWTIPIDLIDLEKLRQFDIDGLWAQMYMEVNTHPNGLQCFRLTRLEQFQLQVRNLEHEKPLTAETEVRDILTDAQTNYTRYSMMDITISDWKEYYSSLACYKANQIGKVLSKMGYEQSKSRANGRTYELPVPSRLAGQQRTG